MSYLNETGLAYFWGKIKAWANSVFALIGHKHPSSDVNAMTGYSMPSSTGAISSGDTLNQAVGKLEKAVSDADLSNVVHITGTETITGSKRFTNRNTQIRSTACTVGEAYSSDVPINDRYDALVFSDKNGVWCAAVELSFRESGLTDFKIYCVDPANPSLDEFAYIYIGYDANGERYATTTSTSSTRSDGHDILTRNWIPQDARIVHTTGNETISGSKTFANGITFTDRTGTEVINALYGKIATTDYFRIQAGGTAANAGYLEIATADDDGNEPIYARQYSGVFNTISRELVLLDGNGQTHFPGNVRLKNNAVTKGTPPASNTWWNLQFTDANDAEMGSLQYGYLSNGQSYMRVGAVKSDTTDFCGIYVGFATDGTAYAAAPSTKSTRSEGTDIVTRDWIPQDTRVVHTTGNEAVAGSKTFSDRVYIQSQQLAAADFKYTSFSIPSVPSENKYLGYRFTDNSGRVLVDCYNRINSSGDQAKVWALHDTKSTNTNKQFVYQYIADGDKFYLAGPADFDYTDDSGKIPNTAWLRRATGNFACNAATATKLATSRTIRTNLASTSTASFDGSANVTPGVTGTLSVANGGTGLTSLDTFVRTTGDQTVGGEKKFTVTPIIERANPYLVFRETDTDRTTNSAGYHGIAFNDKNARDLGNFLYVGETISGQSKPNHMIRMSLFGHGSTDVQRMLVLCQDNATSTPVYSFQARGGGNDIRLGNAGNRWKQLYATTTSIDTSDERLKSFIEPVPDSVLDAWADVDWYMFKMNDAIAEKGADNARTHSGLIAQRLASVFERHGLDGFAYSFLCHDVRDARPASYGAGGKLVMPAEPAVDEYSVRYAEALCIEAAWQRRENARLKKRVADLEERLAALELRLGSE